MNIYDQDKRVIAIYKKAQEGKQSQFVSTCRINRKEEAHLFETGGNFITEAGLSNQNAITIINNPKN